MTGTHSHACENHLSETDARILSSGLKELIAMTAGLDSFQPMPSDRDPLPLACAAYGTDARARQAVEDVRVYCESDPVHALEAGLALVELFESNQPDSAGLFPEDQKFMGQVFSSKRQNGWCALLGGNDESRAEIENAIKEAWRFTFFPSPEPYRPTGIYVLLERLMRYAFIYGRCEPGDSHNISHFVEDHTSGVLVCLEPMSDLELTLSLAAMKMGVPAVVPENYPFRLGRFLKASRTDEITEAVTGFANIRKLLPHPDLPDWPEYCLDEHPEKTGTPTVAYGETDDSFCMFLKAAEPVDGTRMIGKQVEGDTSLGVLIEAYAEPLDAVDRDYIERNISGAAWRVKGHSSRRSEGKLLISVDEDEEFAPEKVADVLRVALMRGFPKIKDVRITLFLNREVIAEGGWAEKAAEEQARRKEEITSLNEDNCPTFYSCVGCSPFAPDHVCVITPDRVPQCGRAYARIKTGALYGYDDMSNIHHSKLHRTINSFLVLEKGKCIDALAGEWEGANKRAVEMTEGRTTRIQLHSLEVAPTTGCGCFRMIMFKTDKPRAGIGIIDRSWKNPVPDGRTWTDLHYALGGKQTPGLSGCSAGYLKSPKFLQADGGWDSIVWVSPKVAKIAGDKLREKTVVG